MQRLAKIEQSLASAFDIKFVFNKWTLGRGLLQGDVLKLTDDRLGDLGFRHADGIGFLQRPISTAPIFMSAGR